MRARAAIAVAAALYLLGLVVFGGVLIERLRFDGRRAVLVTRDDDAAQRVDLRPIDLKLPTGSGRESPEDAIRKEFVP